jgi:hypothetical protein
MKTQIKVRAYSTTFLIDYPKNEEPTIERAIEIVRKKVTYSANVVSLLINKDDNIKEIPNKDFKDPEKFEILNFDMSKYKKQVNK